MSHNTKFHGLSSQRFTTPRTGWKNWSGITTSRPQLFTQPRNEHELSELIERAAASGARVKPVGAGHSFTDVAATDGIQINLDKMSGLVRVDRDSMTARIKAGTRLRDIPALLHPHGVALANQGDVDPQALAGAVSTGTHGTGLGFTGFAGMVRAFRIVTPSGEVVEATPEAPGIAGRLYELGRVSLGAYGVITEIELDIVDTFVLEAVEQAEELSGVIDTFADRARAVDHFEYYWFPHTGVAHTKTNTRRPGDHPTKPIPRWKAVVEDELANNLVFGAMCHLASAIPPLSAPLARISAKTLAQREYSDLAHDVFVSSRRVRFNEMEYAIPLTDATEVLREIRQAINSCGEQVLFPIEVRATAADDVPLSTAKGRETCYIAVHRFHKDDHRALFRAVEPILKAAGGRPHWGKLHTLTHEELAERHEDLERAMELRTKVDPKGTFRNAMTDRIFGLP